MKRLLSLVPLGILLTALPAQEPSDVVLSGELAGPVPSLMALPPQDSEAKLWKGAVNFGGSLSTGNTNRRTGSLAAEGTREEGRHRTTLKGSWNYSEQKTAPSTWRLDQRRTAGSAKHDYFLSDRKKTYTFAAVDAENNFNQAVDLRYTATAGVGTQLVKKENYSLNVEVGAGYFSEKPRVGPTTDFLTGRAGWDADWKINEQWQLLNSLKYFFSLEDGDEMYGEVDTRVRTKLSESMFGQLQWVVTWDNTPIRIAGVANDRIDHLILLSIGWTL